MYGKVFLVFLSTIVLTEAAGKCPGANKLAQAGTNSDGVECPQIDGCNFENNGTLTPLATQCSNELPDADCAALFPCDRPASSAPTGTPDCNQATPAAGSSPSSFPMVRALSCTSASARIIALQCKYYNIINCLNIY